MQEEKEKKKEEKYFAGLNRKTCGKINLCLSVGLLVEAGTRVDQEKTHTSKGKNKINT